MGSISNQKHMLYEDIQILRHHGRQYIPRLDQPQLPVPFRGRPVLMMGEAAETAALADMCPTGAIYAEPFRLDMGKCAFCGECAQAYPHRVKFTQDYQLATNDPQRLIIAESQEEAVTLDADKVRKDIRRLFKGSLKLRQISAGGDNSCEWELKACGNVNFDMGRYGIEFVASPRHADGVVITGPLSANMAEATAICYQSVPDPRIVVLVGNDAISGGIFAGSPALDRRFLSQLNVDLYVPGNPPHPLTFINGILQLIGRKI